MDHMCQSLLQRMAHQWRKADETQQKRTDGEKKQKDQKRGNLSKWESITYKCGRVPEKDHLDKTRLATNYLIIDIT